MESFKYQLAISSLFAKYTEKQRMRKRFFLIDSVHTLIRHYILSEIVVTLFDENIKRITLFASQSCLAF